MAKVAKAKSPGNVTVVDLGEEVDKHMSRKIDQKLRAAGVETGVQKEKMAGSFGYRQGGFRPGMFGQRPWYADRQNRFGMTMGGSYSERWRGLMRPNLGHAAIGALIGGLVDAGLLRVTPDVIKSQNGLLNTGLVAALGLVPVFVKPNSYTLGVAMPGAVMFGLSIINYAMDSLGFKKPALSGAGPAAGVDAQLSARQKLAQTHQAMQRQAPARVPAVAV